MNTNVEPVARQKLPGLVVLGYVTAVLVPVVGFVLGIVVATGPAQELAKHGWKIILLSIVVFAILFGIVESRRAAEQQPYVCHTCSLPGGEGRL
jgi:hypothetical protein